MFCIAVTMFVESLSSFTKQDILQVQQISGYGVGCSGDRIFGVYKMEIKFGKKTNFVTKVDIGPRERLKSAAIIDYTLIKYFQQKE